MECPSCRETIADGTNFCPFCGQSTARVPTAGGGAGADDATVALGGVRPASGGEPAELRACPRCSASNGPHRVLCGRCGADLDTGDRGVTPTWDVDDLRDDDPDRQASSDRTSIVVVVLAVGAIIGLLVGGVLLLGLPRGTPDGPVFDPGVYPEAPAPLAVAGVTPTSVRPPEGAVTFDTSNLFDGDRATVWAPAEAATGAGVTVRLSEPAWVNALVVDLPSEPDDARRPTELLVTLTDRAVFVIDFEDRSGIQAVRLPEPVLTRQLEIEVVDLGPGSGPLVIAGIDIRGWEARGADRDRAS